MAKIFSLNGHELLNEEFMIGSLLISVFVRKKMEQVLASDSVTTRLRLLKCDVCGPRCRIVVRDISYSSRGSAGADAAAKATLSSSLANAVKCPVTDLYQNLANHCQRLWQAE